MSLLQMHFDNYSNVYIISDQIGGETFNSVRFGDYYIIKTYTTGGVVFVVEMCCGSSLDDID